MDEEKKLYYVYMIFCINPKIHDGVFVGYSSNMYNTKYEHRKNLYNPNRPRYNDILYRTVRETGRKGNREFTVCRILRDEDSSFAYLWDLEILKKVKCSKKKIRKITQEFKDKLNSILNTRDTKL